MQCNHSAVPLFHLHSDNNILQLLVEINALPISHDKRLCIYFCMSIKQVRFIEVN